MPGTIGPYKILKRLGKGGMGEVFLAFDSRLNRYVAIKKLRLDRMQGKERTDRLRREASMAANLNHPSVVQIFDILTDSHGDAIVMEFVDGPSLRQIVMHGPLPPMRVAELGAQIASGLYHAHHHGVVHRDLKLENVLVGPNGRAKISDFGVAKDFSNTGLDQTSISKGDLVVGTVTAMSPEQARGERVDYRTDLFSLGSLLYELLTGFSPFKAGNRMDTLDKIVHGAPTPLADEVQGVPRELENMIAQMLQKRPELRPRHAMAIAETLGALIEVSESSDSITLSDEEGEELLDAKADSPQSVKTATRTVRIQPRRWRFLALTALLFGLAGAGFWWLAPSSGGARAAPRYVAVVRSAVEPGLAAEAEYRAELAALQALAALEGVHVVNPGEVAELSGAPGDLARAVAADMLLYLQARCQDDLCQLRLSRLRGTDGSTVWAREIAIPAQREHAFASAVQAQIQAAFPELELLAPTGLREIGAAHYARYLELSRQLDRGELPHRELLARVEDMRLAAPKFLEATYLEVRILRELYLETRETGYLDRGFALLDAAGRIAAWDERPHALAADLALLGGQIGRAETEINALLLAFPHGAMAAGLRARLAEKRGDYVRALELSALSAERHPSAERLFNLGKLQFHQGQIEAARTTFREILDKVPHYRRGRRMLAQMELVHGNPARAIALLRQLAEEEATVANLSNLGMAYMLTGDFDQARQVLERAHEMAPGQIVVVLNLADAHALGGQTERAREWYRAVLDRIEADGNSRDWLGYRAQALAHLGDDLAAIEAMQRALESAPGDPNVLYQASLVYTLAADRASAVVYAKRALAAGMDRRWFNFSWFDPLQEDQAFVAALRAGGT